MAEVKGTDVKFGSGIFKDAQGNIVRIQGLTQNDVTKIKTYHSKVDTLETQIKSINAGQRMIALNDYYTSDEHDQEMQDGVYYMVPFNSKDQFLQWDSATGKPNVSQAPDVEDTKVAYFWVVYKTALGVKQKLAKQDVQPEFKDVAFLAATQTFTGENTFSVDVNLPDQAEATDTLGAQKAASAGFVRNVVKKSITDAGHLKGKYYAEGAPSDDLLVVNELAFFAATDLIA